MKIVAVASARPNFIKIAPLMREMRARPGLVVKLVHTGQHYDARMSRLFFEELAIPRPDVELEVGSASHAVQTAEVMKRFEPILQTEVPNAVLVVGDVNSTLACALTAAKLLVPVAHVEAGLRSFDRTMPEEINRIVTDALSDWLFVTEPSGVANLRNEGVPNARVFLVGNVMMDTLVACRERIDASPILQRLKLDPDQYAVLTLHRPANVDEPMVLDRLMGAVDRLQREVPFVFPVHPRTRQKLAAYQQGGLMRNLIFTDPLGYLDFMKVLSHARLVLTDSGGVQEETTFLGVPCLTMRENTERPITVTEGTNRLVGLDPQRIVTEGLRALGSKRADSKVPALWDGRAAGRIFDVLANTPTREGGR